MILNSVRQKYCMLQSITSLLRKNSRQLICIFKTEQHTYGGNRTEKSEKYPFSPDKHVMKDIRRQRLRIFLLAGLQGIFVQNRSEKAPIRSNIRLGTA